MQTDSFAGMFDQNADQWARQEPMILSDFTARPLVLQELAPVTGMHVLDLGCGEGYVARLVAQAGAQSVFGIDISSEMVTRAQQAAANGAPCPMTFKSGNATNFQGFPREQFDRVIAVFMVSYLSCAEMTEVFRTVRFSKVPWVIHCRFCFASMRSKHLFVAPSLGVNARCRAMRERPGPRLRALCRAGRVVRSPPRVR